MSEPNTELIYRTDDPAGGAKPLVIERSQIAGVSIRGWLAVMLSATVCGMSASQITVVEPLYSAMLLALGFYFGQKKP